MRITVNDDQLRVDESTTVADLLTRLGLPDSGIAVAVNGSVRPRSRWGEPVPEGAHVEVVTAVQGG